MLVVHRPHTDSKAPGLVVGETARRVAIARAIRVTERS